MVNECNFDQEDDFFFKVQGETLKSSFEKRNLPCHLLDSEQQVYEFIKSFVNDHSYIHNIAFSDGVTLYQLDLFNWVKKNFPDKLINQPLERGTGGHYAVFGEQPEGRMNLPYDEWKEKNDLWYQNCRNSLLSDLLIISANAVTMNGEIISVDGLGNRVAGMIFGPLHVICIVGKNKIMPNEEMAKQHIFNEVVPKTYIRHIMKHSASFNDVPCVKKGKCFNCNHEYSSCRDVVTIRGQIKQHSDRIHLLVINKNLGF